MVSLLDNLGDEVLKEFYNFPKQRKEILEKWRHRVGPVFNKLRVCILPSEQTDFRTNRDGTNYNFEVQKSYRETRKVKVELFHHGDSVAKFASMTQAYNSMGITRYKFEQLITGQLKHHNNYTIKVFPNS